MRPAEHLEGLAAGDWARVIGEGVQDGGREYRRKRGSTVQEIGGERGTLKEVGKDGAAWMAGKLRRHDRDS